MASTLQDSGFSADGKRLRSCGAAALAVGIAAAILYLGLMPIDFPLSGDTIREAELVEQGQNVPAFDHLTTGTLFTGAYRLTRLLGYRGKAFLVLQCVTALAGAVGIACVVWLGCRLTGSWR